MRRVLAPVFILALGAAACAGPAASPASQGGAPTTAPSAAQSAAVQPTPAPPVGGEVVSVTLTGGPDAGTYTGAGTPNCSYGLVGPEGWGVQFSIDNAGPDQLSSLQMVAAAPGKEDDDNATFKGTKFLMTAGIGPLFAEGYREYEVSVKTDASESSGTGSAQVTDGGSTAVIHATGTTADGVGIDAKVTCPSVFRQ